MSEIKALEELREKLERDTSKAKLYPTAPIKHAFAEGVTIEGYRALADAIEAEIAERFMELPVDADGVPIKPGDIMQFRDDAPVRVDSIGNSKCYVGDFGWFGGNGGFYGKGTLKCCRHVKPRTLEDVLNDCADEISEKRGIAPELNRDTPTRNEIVDKYADEIRELLRGDAE